MGNKMKNWATPQVIFADKLLHEETILSKPGRGVNTQISGRQYGTHFKSDVNV